MILSDKINIYPGDLLKISNKFDEEFTKLKRGDVITVTKVKYAFFDFDGSPPVKHQIDNKRLISLHVTNGGIKEEIFIHPDNIEFILAKLT